MDKPVKTQKAGRAPGKRGGKTSTSWKPGQSGNPAGAPKRGQSWTEVIEELSELDGPSAAERAGFLAAQFRKLPGGVTLKELVILRVLAALIDEPQPGLLNTILDRAEGKVTVPLDHVVHGTVFDYEAAIAALTSGSEADSSESG